MKKSGIVMLMLGVFLATTTISHAGWFKDAGRSIGKSTRQVSESSKRSYNNAKSYTSKNKSKWKKSASKTYKDSKKASRDARDGFREGYKVKVEDKGFSQVVDYEKTVQMDKHFSRNF